MTFSDLVLDCTPDTPVIRVTARRPGRVGVTTMTTGRFLTEPDIDAADLAALATKTVAIYDDGNPVVQYLTPYPSLFGEPEQESGDAAAHVVGTVAAGLLVGTLEYRIARNGRSWAACVLGATVRAATYAFVSWAARKERR